MSGFLWDWTRDTIRRSCSLVSFADDCDHERYSFTCGASQDSPMRDVRPLKGDARVQLALCCNKCDVDSFSAGSPLSIIWCDLHKVLSTFFFPYSCTAALSW